MRRTTIVTTALATGLIAATAGAQGSSGIAPSKLISIGIGGGVVVPRAANSINDLESGVAGQGFILIRPVPFLPAFRATVDLQKYGFKRPASATNATAIEGDRTVLAGLIGTRIDLLPGPVRPYLTAHLGAFNVKDAIDNPTDQDLSQTNFGVDGGAGLAIRLGPINAFAETRLQNVWTKNKGFVDTKSIQAFPVTFGIIF